MIISRLLAAQNTGTVFTDFVIDRLMFLIAAILCGEKGW